MKLKIVILFMVVIVFTTSIIAFANSDLAESIFISQEESEKNIAEGKQYKIDSMKEKEALEAINKENYKKHGKVYQPEKVSDASNLDKIKNNLSKEKKQEFEKWKKKGGAHVGIYLRKLQQIVGTLPADTKRINMLEVKQIVSSNDFNEAIDKIQKTHGTPDYKGGSGVTIEEYWLDDRGNEKIVIIIEQNQIFYSKMNDELNLNKSELLLED